MPAAQWSIIASLLSGLLQGATESTVALLCWERVCKMERTVSVSILAAKPGRQEAGGEMGGKAAVA